MCVSLTCSQYQDTDNQFVTFSSGAIHQSFVFCTQVFTQHACDMTSTALVGLIYPPADIRAIIDKTAQMVARLGAEFEGKVQREASRYGDFVAAFFVFVWCSTGRSVGCAYFQLVQSFRFCWRAISITTITSTRYKSSRAEKSCRNLRPSKSRRR